MSQQQVAQRLPHSQRFVSRCETGERRIDVFELRAFCRALDIPFVDFVEQLDNAITDLEQL
ncbi:MAG: helix-turn-helix transcriptional regulator [Abitibacteriaceae bacterium]|nr:helix-turn-helix transcriptional regulator [Abditibacteriaceae bacterium]